MNSKLNFLFTLIALITPFAGLQAQAPQVPGSGVNAVIAKLFSDHKAFSATAALEIRGKSAGENVDMTAAIASLDGRMRMDLDLAQMRSAQLPADAVSAMKQMGMDRLSSIVKPQDKVLLILYPGLKSYVEMALPAEEAQALSENYQLQKAVVGKETIAGHPTVKHKVTITDGKGLKQEAITWNATDLKDFPVKVEITEKERTISMTYRDVSLNRPDAAQFVAPEGFAKHASFQALMQAAMMRMIGGGAK